MSQASVTPEFPYPAVSGWFTSHHLCYLRSLANMWWTLYRLKLGWMRYMYAFCRKLCMSINIVLAVVTGELRKSRSKSQWWRKDGWRGHPPGRHCAGGGIWRGRKLNYEIWPLLANWHLHCITLTLTWFWNHTPTVSAPLLHTKQYVHQKTYTADLTDHSPAVKLYRRSILSS